MNVLIIILLFISNNKYIDIYDKMITAKIKTSENNEINLKCYEISKNILKKIFNKNIKYKCKNISYFIDYTNYINKLCSHELMNDVLDGEIQKCTIDEYNLFIKKYDTDNKYKNNNDFLINNSFCQIEFEMELNIDDFYQKIEFELFINAKTMKLLFYNMKTKDD